jgi:hypothetical protein
VFLSLQSQPQAPGSGSSPDAEEALAPNQNRDGNSNLAPRDVTNHERAPPDVVNPTNKVMIDYCTFISNLTYRYSGREGHERATNKANDRFFPAIGTTAS